KLGAAFRLGGAGLLPGVHGVAEDAVGGLAEGHAADQLDAGVLDDRPADAAQQGEGHVGALLPGGRAGPFFVGSGEGFRSAAPALYNDNRLTERRKGRQGEGVGWVESSRPTTEFREAHGGPRRLDPPYFSPSSFPSLRESSSALGDPARGRRRS